MENGDVLLRPLGGKERKQKKLLKAIATKRNAECK